MATSKTSASEEKATSTRSRKGGGHGKEKNLNDLFLHTLKDVYYAEKQIFRNLPKMSKAAESDELKEAFEHHREETNGHIERLEQVFQICGARAQAIPCEAIQGVLEENKEMMDDFSDSEALDAGLAAGGQAIEHYEIARYGTLKAWAEQLGMKDVVKLLDENLKEEKKADELLTKIAESMVNEQAAA